MQNTKTEVAQEICRALGDERLAYQMDFREKSHERKQT